MTYRKTCFESPDLTYIPGGLNVGAQIIIRGRVALDQERFIIDLQNDKVEGCDVAFHFNPRTGNSSVVRNSHSRGWQTEELCIPFFPFASGSKFTVRIYVGAESYVVFVNCKHFIEYKHRLPYKSVRYLRLGEGAEYYECTIQNPCRTPYKGEFPGGLKTGKAVKVQGFVNEDAKSFAISFNCDVEGSVVGAHFNVSQVKKEVVLNSKTKCSWGQEEQVREGFPFLGGQYFDVLIITNAGCFDIYVNDKLFTSFKFRIPPEQILYLSITGDVTLREVVFADSLPKDLIKPVPSGLEKNDLIAVSGFFCNQVNTFSIDLINVTGTCAGKDIALRVNTRFSESTVVINSQKNGKWQKEQKLALPCPFVHKLPFEVEIVNKCGKFKIYVNGRCFANFEAQGKLEDIKGISAQGEVCIYEVKLLRTLEIPFIDRLPGSFDIGSWIKVTGTPKKNAQNFQINLQCGDDTEGGCDVAFQFRPCFNQGCTFRNSKIAGKWGKEVNKQSEFPFKPEDRFEVAIVRLCDVLRVFVNKKYYIAYVHRVDACRISHILLAGDCNFFEPEFY